MKIKLDENLPVLLKVQLSLLGHDVHTTPEEGLAGFSDHEIWSMVQSESRFFITQDMDFADLRKYLPGSHCGILLLRVQPADRRVLIERIVEIFHGEDVSNWSGCFVVATESKVRIIKPSQK